MKKSGIIIGLILCIMTVGCKSNYIDNKKDIPTEKQENSTTTEYILQETISHENTDNEDTKQFTFYTFLKVVAENGTQGARVSVVDINEGINKMTLSMICSPDPSLDWDTFSVKIYVIDNGNPIPFKIGDSNYNIYQEVEYKSNEQLNYVIDFDENSLSCENGKITVIAIFNPKALPGFIIESFGATQTYDFYYSNKNYMDNGSVQYDMITEEYIEIPKQYVKNAQIADIALKDVYKDDYYWSNSHYKDIEVKNLSELYVHFNAGIDIDCDALMGIICDGELLQFSDGTYFKQFKCCNGSKTLQYQLSEFDNIEEGLHYFQLIVLPISTFENQHLSVRTVTNRFRVNITE